MRQHRPHAQRSHLMTQLEQLLSTTEIYFLHLSWSSNNNHLPRPLSPPGCSPSVSPAPNLFCQHRLQHTNLTDEDWQLTLRHFLQWRRFICYHHSSILPSYFCFGQNSLQSHYFSGPVQWSVMVFFLILFFSWSIIALQCCVSFSCITMWINYKYVYIYITYIYVRLCLEPLSHPPPSHPSRSSIEYRPELPVLSLMVFFTVWHWMSTQQRKGWWVTSPSHSKARGWTSREESRR